MELIISLHKKDLPLHRQIYQEIRDLILSGNLKSGQRLPSTRILAKTLSVSRATVTQSYEQLFSEGYLETRQGAGTYVCSQLPDDLLKTVKKEKYTRKINANQLPSLSNYALNLQKNERLNSLINPDRSRSENIIISFEFGSPALDRFPWKQWQKLILQSSKTENIAIWDYNRNPFGYQPLRKAIAEYLIRSRAVNCNSDRIIIVNGSQQALDLIMRIFVDRGDNIAMEDPGYLGARDAFLAGGANILPLQVDEEGMRLEFLKNTNKITPKLIHVTPSHQFPTGVVLSLPRRLELLKLAKNFGMIIIEDDYDSEFRYSSRPIPALQGLDNNNSVIYVGTFSKIMFPALRLGYLVVPENLVDIFAKVKWLSDRRSSILEQLALTDFIDRGYLESHLRKMRTLYDRRRQVLIGAIERYLGNKVTILGENAGIHLMVRFTTHLEDVDIINKAAKLGVKLVSTAKYYWQKSRSGEFVLGYANLNENAIEAGIKKLAIVLTEK